jgi:hypothetical protein
MPDILISALVQTPFVLVMVYLVQRFLAHMDARDEEWRNFIERADEQLADRLDHLASTVERLSVLVINHDAAVRGWMRASASRDRSEHETRLRVMRD